MRAALVIKVVEAVNQGTTAFRDAVAILANEEEKKGNKDIAEKLRCALSKKIENSNEKNIGFHNFFPFNRTTTDTIPKDKDSSFSLFETIEPSVDFEQLFYSPEVFDLFQQIILEWSKTKQLLDAGILPTHRILLYGPPGCGKTMAGLALAKAIGMSIAYVRADGFFSSFLGQTSNNLRRIFEAIISPPRILFLDEFDAVAKKRDDSREIGEIKRIVISLLQNLDFLPPEVIVIAATNHEHLLDPAVWRRFDVSVGIGLPNYDIRKRMIETWLQPYKSQMRDVDIDIFAKITDNFSVAKIKNIILQTIKRVLILGESSFVTLDDFKKQLIFLEGYN
jgi:SpoVK/Ycf46/Vps4 family AAA+-type ATPase